MNMKKFLEELSNLTNYFSPEALDFYNELKEQNTTEKMFTENGIKILMCMQENVEKYINIFTAKNIGEILFMSPRSVSGSMKKLIADGYVEKVGISPVSYGLTELGKGFKLDN